jgi:hypothetical protein
VLPVHLVIYLNFISEERNVLDYGCCIGLTSMNTMLYILLLNNSLYMKLYLTTIVFHTFLGLRPLMAESHKTKKKTFHN